MSSESLQSSSKPLILLCDGTWCGRETSTRTNIYLLAEMIGIPIADPNDTDEHIIPHKARYIHGVGLGSTFLDYIFNGITAQDIAFQCISAYKFIVLNYTYPDTKIWMFGLSRGAYTVRCVAGMINNCGIVRPVKSNDGTINELETALLCEEVHRIYRSRYTINEPHSPQSENFRKKASWPLIGDEDKKDPLILPPIKFMGLIDTVGSLGLPSFTGGVGLEWPEFYDQDVSAVVENVYQILSLHDRLYIFEPCLAKRNMEKHPGKVENFGITQEWFPGVHYDVAPQRFRFLRGFSGGKLEPLLARWSWLSRVIQPNEVLGNLVLKRMLEAIETHYPSGEVIPNIGTHITDTTSSIIDPNRQTGDGDVYSHIVDYVPLGSILLGIWRAIWGTWGRSGELYQLFFALKDRNVPDDNATIYNYEERDRSISATQTIQELADIPSLTLNDTVDKGKRYPSKAYEALKLRLLVSR